MNQQIAAWQDDVLSPVDKLEVHKKGLKHPAVSVFVKRNNEILLQKKTISKFDVDSNELEFLRLNLEYGHKCRKSFFNNKGFIVGSEDYKNCVLDKGRIDG